MPDIAARPGNPSRPFVAAGLWVVLAFSALAFFSDLAGWFESQGAHPEKMHMMGYAWVAMAVCLAGLNRERGPG